MVDCTKQENITEVTEMFQKRMSQVGGAFREIHGMKDLLQDVTSQLEMFTKTCHVQSVQQLKNFYQLRDMLLCQQTYLIAMINYAESGNHSRGGTVYLEKNGDKIHPLLPDEFCSAEEPENPLHMIQETSVCGDNVDIRWRAPRPTPKMDSFFENIWKQYRVNRNVY